MRKAYAIFAFFVQLVMGRAAYCTPHDTELWLQLTNNIPLDKERTHQVFFELNAVDGDNLQRMAGTGVRTAYNYNVSKQVSLFLGHFYGVGFYDGQYHRTTQQENDVWEQVTIRHDLFGVQWQHRIRQEQRFIESNDEMLNRSRYQLRASKAVTQSGNIGITAFNEYFRNLDGDRKGYDRDQMFIGPYIKTDKGRYEVGYLGQHDKNFGGDQRWVNGVFINGTINW